MKQKLWLISIIGALLTISFMSTFRVWAENSDPIQTKSGGLEAVVRGESPKIPATIATPSNGQAISSIPLKISGLCTGDVLVKVFDNGVFVGSAQCVNGSYSLSSDLFIGKNDLVAKVYDALDQQGPDSNTVTVNFSQSGYNTNVPRVTITSDYAKRGADPKQLLSWPIVMSGGTAPYAASIDWGDGTNQLKSIATAGTFNIEHAYDNSGLYTITIKVTDANNNSSFLQLVGVSNGAITQANQAAAVATAPVVVEFIWWPIVVAAVLIVVSFWLGSRYKLVSLRKQAEKRIQY